MNDLDIVANNKAVANYMNDTNRGNDDADKNTNMLKSPVLGAVDGKEAICTPIHTTHPKPEISMFTIITSYVSLLMFVIFNYIRESYRSYFPHKNTLTKPGYAPLMKDFDDYWNRRFYRRIRDLWNRPIDSRPSRVIGVMERVSHDFNATFEFTGKIIPAVNMGSYNYLGFAEDTPSITRSVVRSIDTLGVASCSAPQEAGQSSALQRLEK